MAHKKSTKVAGKRLVDRVTLRYGFGEQAVSVAPVDAMVQLIRQWVGMLAFDDPEARQIAMLKLREVATSAVQERLTSSSNSSGGKKGGLQPKERDLLQLGTGKRAAIIAEAAKYIGTESARVATIKKKTGATGQYIRRVLKEIGNSKPL